MFLILFSISLCFSWVSPDTNSLTVIYTAVSGIRGFPQVSKAAMINGVQVNYHDSNSRRTIPRLQTVADTINEEFWERLTDLSNKQSDMAGESLSIMMKNTNQTSVQPEVFISRSEANSQYKPLTLSCLVTGFYPVDIEVTWLRNGEVMSETLSSGVRPNHDGSHQIQKEIEINAGDEDQYSCQIEHSRLAEAKLHQWEILENSGDGFHLGIIIGLVITVLAVIFGIIGIIIWKRQRKDSPSGIYTTAHTSDVPVPERS